MVDNNNNIETVQDEPTPIDTAELLSIPSPSTPVKSLEDSEGHEDVVLLPPLPKPSPLHSGIDGYRDAELLLPPVLVVPLTTTPPPRYG